MCRKVFRKTHYIRINSKYYAWNNKEDQENITV